MKTIKQIISDADPRLKGVLMIMIVYVMVMATTVTSGATQEDTYEVLKRNGHPGIMHCYSGSVEMAKRFIDLGFYISLAGPVTFKNARVPKDVAEKIGLEHLLIETDCPYLTPHPYRGSLNEPANVVYIAQEIAKLKNMEIESVASQTTFNAKKVFGIK